MFLFENEYRIALKTELPARLLPEILSRTCGSLRQVCGQECVQEEIKEHEREVKVKREVLKKKSQGDRNKTCLC